MEIEAPFYSPRLHSAQRATEQQNRHRSLLASIKKLTFSVLMQSDKAQGICLNNGL